MMLKVYATRFFSLWLGALLCIKFPSKSTKVPFLTSSAWYSYSVRLTLFSVLPTPWAQRGVAKLTNLGSPISVWVNRCRRGVVRWDPGATQRHPFSRVVSSSAYQNVIALGGSVKLTHPSWWGTISPPMPASLAINWLCVMRASL